ARAAARRKPSWKDGCDCPAASRASCARSNREPDMGARPPRFLRRVIALFKWSARDRDMQSEMAFHVESIAREYVRSGMSEADAERAARQRFGSTLHLKERGHDVRTARVLENLSRDVRHMA